MTYFLKAKDIKKDWFVIDASSVVLGRLAAYVVNLLKGKHKSCYTPHMDCGDQIIIVNAEKIALSGNKMRDKVYHWHTGYSGGLRMTTPYDVLGGSDPCRLVKLAVKRMIGYGPMSRKRLGNLYVYSGPGHIHEAQKPKLIDFAKMNSKNIRDGINVC